MPIKKKKRRREKKKSKRNKRIYTNYAVIVFHFGYTRLTHTSHTNTHQHQRARACVCMCLRLLVSAYTIRSVYLLRQTKHERRREQRRIKKRREETVDKVSETRKWNCVVWWCKTRNGIQSKMVHDVFIICANVVFIIVVAIK